MQPYTLPTPLPIEVMRQAHARAVDHREFWAEILPGLQAIQAQGAQDWSIEGLRIMLDEARAALIIDEDDPSGFAIVQLAEYLYNSDEKELFVYVAFHKGGRAIQRFLPHLEHIARSEGATHMRFCSQHHWMLPAALRAGFRPKSVEYVKEVS